jgi:hypothetical protein
MLFSNKSLALFCAVVVKGDKVLGYEGTGATPPCSMFNTVATLDASAGVTEFKLETLLPLPIVVAKSLELNWLTAYTISIILKPVL